MRDRGKYMSPGGKPAHATPTFHIAMSQDSAGLMMAASLLEAAGRLREASALLVAAINLVTDPADKLVPRQRLVQNLEAQGLKTQAAALGAVQTDAELESLLAGMSLGS